MATDLKAGNYGFNAVPYNPVGGLGIVLHAWQQGVGNAYTQFTLSQGHSPRVSFISYVPPEVVTESEDGTVNVEQTVQWLDPAGSMHKHPARLVAVFRSDRHVHLTVTVIGAASPVFDQSFDVPTGAGVFTFSLS